MDWLDRLLGLPQNAIENVGLSWVFLLILLVIAVIAIWVVVAFVVDRIRHPRLDPESNPQGVALTVIFSAVALAIAGGIWMLKAGLAAHGG
jgi:asparagine N-glycosylation enzyme membrane subunit Stt3